MIQDKSLAELLIHEGCSGLRGDWCRSGPLRAAISCYFNGPDWESTFDYFRSRLFPLPHLPCAAIGTPQLRLMLKSIHYDLVGFIDYLMCLPKSLIDTPLQLF